MLPSVSWRRSIGEPYKRAKRPKHGYGAHDLANIARAVCNGLRCEAKYQDPTIPFAPVTICGARTRYKRWWIIFGEDGMPVVVASVRCERCGSHRRVEAGPL